MTDKVRTKPIRSASSGFVKVGRVWKRKYTPEVMFENSIPEPNTGCWLWMGPIAGGTGYGLAINEGKTVGAHRLMFMLTQGSIGNGKDVCHRCDVRACINPTHLFQGTRAENLADMRAKGRNVILRGEKCGKSKLTPQQVREIRARIAEGESTPSLGKRYGVSHQSISAIAHRRNWRHLEDA